MSVRTLPEWTDPEDKTDINIKLVKYATLKQRIKEMNEELKILEDDVASEIAVEYDGKYISALGKFQVQTRKKWEFSQAVIEIEQEVKKQKKIEQLNGTAKVIEEKQILVYTTPKK